MTFREWVDELRREVERDEQDAYHYYQRAEEELEEAQDVVKNFPTPDKVSTLADAEVKRVLEGLGVWIPEDNFFTPEGQN